MKVKTFGYSRCSITVIGTEVVCPFCKATVKSGETHTCEQSIEKPKRKPKP